jgi:hypothetical protein
LYQRGISSEPEHLSQKDRRLSLRRQEDEANRDSPAKTRQEMRRQDKTREEKRRIDLVRRESISAFLAFLSPPMMRGDQKSMIVS